MVQQARRIRPRMQRPVAGQADQGTRRRCLAARQGPVDVLLQPGQCVGLGIRYRIQAVVEFALHGQRAMSGQCRVGRDLHALCRQAGGCVEGVVQPPAAQVGEHAFQWAIGHDRDVQQGGQYGVGHDVAQLHWRHHRLRPCIGAAPGQSGQRRILGQSAQGERRQYLRPHPRCLQRLRQQRVELGGVPLRDGAGDQHGPEKSFAGRRMGGIQCQRTPVQAHRRGMVAAGRFQAGLDDQRVGPVRWRLRMGPCIRRVRRLAQHAQGDGIGVAGFQLKRAPAEFPRLAGTLLLHQHRSQVDQHRDAVGHQRVRLAVVLFGLRVAVVVVVLQGLQETLPGLLELIHRHSPMRGWHRG